jgi:hypothetical protein
VALNKLTKLHKSGRTLLKQQVRVLQQQWQSLRPLDGEQQQQMEQLQQQHKQQQEEVTAVLAKIVERLYAVSWIIVNAIGGLGNSECI